MINTDLSIYKLIILIAFLINILVVTYIAYKKDKLTVKKIGLITIIIFTSKFILDFLRYTHETSLISVNQIACIPSILFGFYLMKKRLTNSS